jgi:hypothetical protein
MSVMTTDRPITERQKAFIEKLLVERDTTSTAYEGWTPEWYRATSPMASSVIDFLLTLPVKGASSSAAPTVPAGRYAVETEEGHLAFYRVDCPTEGTWAGRTFVKVQASDELHPVRGAAAASVLRKIAVDPAAASLRYGREIGSCGVCGRTLTDEDSRARGIGPICAEKTGW